MLVIIVHCAYELITIDTLLLIDLIIISLKANIHGGMWLLKSASRVRHFLLAYLFLLRD